NHRRANSALKSAKTMNPTTVSRNRLFASVTPARSSVAAGALGPPAPGLGHGAGRRDESGPSSTHGSDQATQPSSASKVAVPEGPVPEGEDEKRQERVVHGRDRDDPGGVARNQVLLARHRGDDHPERAPDEPPDAAEDRGDPARRPQEPALEHADAVAH